MIAGSCSDRTAKAFASSSSLLVSPYTHF
jgi:hypothetical protein